MLRHYLMTAVRGLLRHKLYSFINVAGFSIGLAAAILISLYANTLRVARANPVHALRYE